jgi:hypothetical protein
MAKAFRSAVINGPIEAVWQTIRPFDALPAWQPLCPDTHIEGGESPVMVGSIRNIKQTDGGHFRERLLSISDIEHSQTYMLLDPPLSVTSMVTTLRLYPITDGDRSYLSWSSEVVVGKQDEASFIKLLHDSFMIGINNLKTMFDTGDGAALGTKGSGSG